MRAIETQLLIGDALYREVVQNKLVHARERVWISTANVKAMMLEWDGKFVPVAQVFGALTRKGVEVRVLHAELPSRPFRNAFDKARLFGQMELKICPRVHFKAVLIDNAWAYLGSANLTGAGLGAKHKDARNFEVGFVTEDFGVIDQTTALFESVWNGSECRNCRLHSVCPDPIGPGPAASRKKRGGSGTGVRLGKSRRFSLGGRRG